MSISPAKLERQRALVAARAVSEGRGGLEPPQGGQNATGACRARPRKAAQARDPRSTADRRDPQLGEFATAAFQALHPGCQSPQAPDSNAPSSATVALPVGNVVRPPRRRGSPRSAGSSRASRGGSRPENLASGRSRPARLTAEEEIAIERLAAERAVEGSGRADAAAARAAVQASMARQVAILDELAAGRVPFTLVALRLSLLAGRAVTPAERRRLARGLCKRRQRAKATDGRPNLPAPPASPTSPPISSAETTDAARSGEEKDMAQLVKRTITEEYTTVEEDFDGMEELDEEDEDQEEEAAPSRRSKR